MTNPRSASLSSPARAPHLHQDPDPSSARPIARLRDFLFSIKPLTSSLPHPPPLPTPPRALPLMAKIAAQEAAPKLPVCGSLTGKPAKTGRPSLLPRHDAVHNSLFCSFFRFHSVHGRKISDPLPPSPPLAVGHLGLATAGTPPPLPVSSCETTEGNPPWIGMKKKQSTEM